MSVQKMSETTDSDVLLFTSLVDLIRHTDEQLTKTTEYYLAALGAVIAVAAVLDQLKAAWPAYVGILLLAASLALRWFSTATKLGKDKLCWTLRARELETTLFPKRVGPFSAQMQFFRASARADISFPENWLLSAMGPAVLRRTSTFILVIGLAVVVAGLSAPGLSRSNQLGTPAIQLLQQSTGSTK